MSSTHPGFPRAATRRLASLVALIAASGALGACGNDNRTPGPGTATAGEGEPTPTTSATTSSNDIEAESGTAESQPTASATATPPALPDLDFPEAWTAVYLAEDCSIFDAIDTTALIQDAQPWRDFTFSKTGITECNLGTKDEQFPEVTIQVVPLGGLSGQYASDDAFVAYALKEGYVGYNARPAPVAGPWDFGVYDRLWSVGTGDPAEFMGRITYATSDTPGSATFYCEFITDETQVDVDVEDPNLREILEPVTDAVVPYTDEFLTFCTEALKLTSYPMGSVE